MVGRESAPPFGKTPWYNIRARGRMDRGCPLIAGQEVGELVMDGERGASAVPAGTAPVVCLFAPQGALLARSVRTVEGDRAGGSGQAKRGTRMSRQGRLRDRRIWIRRAWRDPGADTRGSRNLSVLGVPTGAPHPRKRHRPRVTFENNRPWETRPRPPLPGSPPAVSWLRLLVSSGPSVWHALDPHAVYAVCQRGFFLPLSGDRDAMIGNKSRGMPA